jgi:hypothetical protein
MQISSQDDEESVKPLVNTSIEINTDDEDFINGRAWSETTKFFLSSVLISIEVFTKGLTLSSSS